MHKNNHLGHLNFNCQVLIESVDKMRGSELINSMGVFVKKQILLLALVLFLSQQVSFALPMNEFPASPWTKGDGYAEKTVGKLGFGLVNIVLGWTALGTEYFEEPDANVGVKFLRSIGRTLTNTVGGALHVVTFPAPFDIKLPGGGTSFGENS